MKLLLLLLAICFNLALSKQRHCKYASKDPAVSNRTAPHRSHYVKPKSAKSVLENGVTIIKTNMDRSDQKLAINIIRRAYDFTDNPMDRARIFQKKLTDRFHSYPHVILNPETVYYWQRFYVNLQIDGDHVNAWGL